MCKIYGQTIVFSIHQASNILQESLKFVHRAWSHGPNHLKLLHCGKIHAAKKQRRGYIYSCGKNTLEEILNKKIIDSRELNYFLTELLLSPRYLLKTHFIML